MKLNKKASLFIILLIIISIFSFNFKSEAKGVKDLKYAVIIPEEIINSEVPDPAAETEIMNKLIENGFKVIDQHYVEEFRYTRDVRKALQNAGKAAEIGKELGVDVLIIGEAFTERVGEEEGLVNHRARLEAKAIKVDTGRVLYTDGIHAPADDITNETAAKSAFKSAATGWVVDFISMQPPEKYGVLIPRFEFGDQVNKNTLSDVIAGDITKEIQRRLLNSNVSENIRILSSGEERAEIYKKIQRDSFKLPSLMLQGKINQFEIEKLDKLDAFVVTHYKLAFNADFEWQIVNQTGDKIVMGNETGSIEYEATYAGLDEAPKYTEMKEDDKMKQALDYIIDQIVIDIQNAVEKQIEQDKSRYKKSALAKQLGSEPVKNISYEFKTLDGDQFKGNILGKISFDSGVMNLTITPKELKKISRKNDEWILKTNNGSQYTGKVISNQIQIKVNNNKLSLSFEDIKSISLVD